MTTGAGLPGPQLSVAAEDAWGTGQDLGTSQKDIDARLARFNLTRDARDLWPDISVSSFRVAERTLADALGAVLRGREAVALECPAGTSLRALGVAATTAGVGALVGYWIETRALVAEPALAALFANHLAHGRRRADRLRRAFEPVLEAFAERGVEVLVFKGCHTSAAYFPDPGTKITSDVDVLVRSEDLPLAQRVLAQLGFEERHDARAPEQSSWSLPGTRAIRALDFTHAESAWSIDLHDSIERIPFGGMTTTLGTPDLARAPVWTHFSRPVRVLPEPLLLAYLAAHTSSHFYAIPQIRLVELVLVAQRDFAGQPERWRAFQELLQTTGTARFVFPALDLAERFVPGSIDAHVLRSVEALTPRRLRRLVLATQPAWGQRLHPFPGLRARFVWVASPREALAALRWLAWPQASGSWWEALGAQVRRLRRVLRRIVPVRVAR
ncbi:MAG TPA: nucleotidyltransferase family protein [Gemmatimonadales bacterium]|nr:nucleotidyltransferase family protein [Gemmatimonadales bacterium]